MNIIYYIRDITNITNIDKTGIDLCRIYSKLVHNKKHLRRRSGSIMFINTYTCSARSSVVAS